MKYIHLNDDMVAIGMLNVIGEINDPHYIPNNGEYDNINIPYVKWTGTEFEDIPIPPPTIVNIPTVDFWERFTSAEQDTLIASTNAIVKRFLFRLRISAEINLLNEKLITFVNKLEEAGAIDPGRADEILAI